MSVVWCWMKDGDEGDGDCYLGLFGNWEFQMYQPLSNQLWCVGIVCPCCAGEGCNYIYMSLKKKSGLLIDFSIIIILIL